MPERRWFTVKEIAQYLHLSPKHVNDLCLRKIIPSIKLAGSRRVDFLRLENVLEKLLEHGTKVRRR